MGVPKHKYQSLLKLLIINNFTNYLYNLQAKY